MARRATSWNGSSQQGYEETVEQLVDPPAQIPRADLHLLFRYMPSLETGGPVTVPGAANWLYHLVNTQRPLEEKMALFWHGIFAVGNSKVDNDNHLTAMVDMFRDHGTGNYRDLLIMLAQSPAMIYWLDNHENHKRSPNENWGRELLELFSMGVGNYTEKDVFECARAFTGWTLGPKIPRVPNHRFFFQFEYRPEEHDFGEKEFLGRTGNFDGLDIIDIILEEDACPALHRPPPVHVLRRRRAAGAGLGHRAAQGSGGDRLPRRRVQGVELRDQAGAARAVQLRLLQGGDLPEGQEPGRDRGLDAAPGPRTCSARSLS